MVAELQLHRLKALRVLGRGAMGTVFLVTPISDNNNNDNNSSLPPLFALKVIEKNKPEAKPDADRRARWELNVLSKLDHSFLPTLLGSLETPEFLAWAIPFCSGGDLHSLRHALAPDAAFSAAAIRFYLSEIISALSYLHSLRIAYRDLKPENILLHSSGHIILTDFDLSRHLPYSSLGEPEAPHITQVQSPKTSKLQIIKKSHTSSSSTNTSPRAPLPPPPFSDHSKRRHRRHFTRIFAFVTSPSSTNTPAVDQNLKKTRSARVSPVSRRRTSFTPSIDSGTSEKSYSFVGTEEYVSPEVVRGEGHEFAVDWWALGILTYEMAYGRTPFRGRNRKETFKNVLTKAPEFGGGSRRSELTDLIDKLLAKDPKKRLGFAGGAEEVKAHPFFKGVKWDLLAEVSRPPFLAPVDKLEEEVSEVGGCGNGEGFDVREYFQRLRMPEKSPLMSSESLSEF